MATFFVVAQNVRGDPLSTGRNIRILGRRNTADLEFTDNDGVLGDPAPGETVSVDGGPPQTYEYLGTGDVRGNPNQTAAFIRLEDGTTFAIDLRSNTEPRLRRGNSQLDTDELDGASVEFPICFTPGTLLATPEGDRPVETLAPGDLLMTADNGPQTICWIGRSEHAWPGTDDKHKPIQIKEGALGNGVPSRDLSVSPQHRVLMAGPQVLKMFGTPEVLALAKGMTGLPGIRVMKGKKAVSYISVLMDRHEVLIAEGARTESFYPGPTALRMLSPRPKDEICALFPALREDPERGYGSHARRVLTKRETEELVASLRADGFSGWERKQVEDSARAYLPLVS